MFRTFNEMARSVICLPTARADRWGRGQMVLEGVQEGVIPWPELGQGCSRYSEEVHLCLIHVRCSLKENPICTSATDRLSHSSRMDHFPSHLNVCNAAINQQIIDLVLLGLSQQWLFGRIHGWAADNWPGTGSIASWGVLLPWKVMA